LLAVLPGWLGIAGLHRFYLGKILTGVIMLLTLGGLGIWTLVDFIMALTGRMKDRQGKPVTEW
jgi:TM2 domain-containing membrane protein YozV